MNLKLIPVDEHALDQNLIDKDALNVINQLQKEGHVAYLVGGGVRDLLLGKTPKDFDISTSALPEEIKRIFGRRCILIGKRFRLAHLRFDKKILEVSTFRSGDLESSTLIVRDNRFGTPEEDVMRRDFTINALFYDPKTHTILDYVDGVSDIKQGVLRTIGDPYARFKQDPVRMLRLLKFLARFGFDIEPKTMRAMTTCKEEILKSAPARILEELFKMLESASAERFFRVMKAHDFLDILFPCFHHFLTGPFAERGFEYLNAIDTLHIKYQKDIDRNVLFCALIFPILECELEMLSSDRGRPISFTEIMQLSDSLLQGINSSSFAHFPRKLLSVTHYILSMQFKLTPLLQKKKLSPRTLMHEDFPKALEFLHVRSKIHPELDTQYRQIVKEINISELKTL